MARIGLATPLGALTLRAQGGAITALDWGRVQAEDSSPELEEARAQLTAYFAGQLTRFDLPLRVDASPFQQEVCARIAAIPFGETRTYGQIAHDMGAPAQAVGAGCGGNPIPILIPCHRVLGANGLGGYSGARGVETKVWLLRHEGAAGLLI